MKHRWWSSAIVIGLSAASALAQVAEDKPAAAFDLLHVGGSVPAADGRALHEGAIFELRLRVPWTSVDAYLEKYAHWYQPVDQRPGSGRKLLDVLLREHGDQYNLVFLYWYKSRYKKDYYCSYFKAFFAVHKDDQEFKDIYKSVAAKEGAPDLASTIAELQKCDPDHLPIVASEVVRTIDSKLRALLELDESTWNIGVNPCRSAALAKPSSAGRGAALNECPELSIESWIRTQKP